MKHLLITTIAAVVLVGCGESPPDISIHDAAEIGDIEAVKQHIAAGTDVNTKDDAHGGTTPLHIAALYGDKELAELLIANGADVNAKTLADDSPLDWTILNEQLKTADLLRKHGGKTGEELKAAGN